MGKSWQDRKKKIIADAIVAASTSIVEKRLPIDVMAEMPMNGTKPLPTTPEQLHDVITSVLSAFMAAHQKQLAEIGRLKSDLNRMVCL